MSDEKHICPHCNTELDPWTAPPDSGWGEILVCNNNECSYFKGSKDEIQGKREDSNLGTRYAVDPANKFKPFCLLSWAPF